MSESNYANFFDVVNTPVAKSTGRESCLKRLMDFLMPRLLPLSTVGLQLLSVLANDLSRQAWGRWMSILDQVPGQNLQANKKHT
jgi:hypothetical protein